MKRYTKKETQYRQWLHACRWMLYRDLDKMKETHITEIVSMISKIDCELKPKAGKK